MRLAENRKTGELLRDLQRAAPGDRKSIESVSDDRTLINKSEYAQTLEQTVPRFVELRDTVRGIAPWDYLVHRRH